MTRQLPSLIERSPFELPVTRLTFCYARVPLTGPKIARIMVKNRKRHAFDRVKDSSAP
jgi:hypothetical protein